MHRFFDSIVGPILEIVEPEVVVEIGSAAGDNTQHLLTFCKRTGATLHVVDPAPGYDADAWTREHEGNLVFHQDLSLNVLPNIDRFQAMLIDGDHNWHTVFRELELIERLSEERGQPLPLMLFHDVGWPYGRRDSYYQPERIPPEERQPYERKGMRPGIPGLVEEGGMNHGFLNAVLEGAPRSGVFTAIENFIEQTDRELRCITVAGMHGLTVLAPEHLQESDELRRFLDGLEPSSALRQHLEQVEMAYLEAEIARQELKTSLRRSEVRRKREVEALRNRLREVRGSEP